MLLLVELLIVTVLLLVLGTLYVEEHRTRHKNVPTGRMTAYWNGKERRRDVRIDNELNVRYMIEKKPHAAGSSLTKNIGMGGICIETSEKILIETLLGLEIDIPKHEKPIVADGKVVWVKDNPYPDEKGKRLFDIGVKFLYMETKEKELLLEYINGITAQPSSPVSASHGQSQTS